jgi:hypothetical protein
MAATITDTLKKELLDDLYSSYTGKLQDSDIPAVAPDNYYIGIGKAEQWTSVGVAPIPTPSTNDVIQFQSSLQSVKKVADVSYVIPRVNWSAGSIYTPWDNTNSSDTTFGTLNDIIGAYYVITDQNNVYICIQQGMTNTGVVSNSLNKPTGITSAVFETGDGYSWKFMYNVGVYNAQRYLTSNYIPVERVPSPSEIGGKPIAQLSASRADQYALQNAAIAGQVIGVAIDSSGIGYPSNANIKVNIDVQGGNPTSAAYAYARTDNNGRIYQCIMKSKYDLNVYEFGAGYGKTTWAEPNADSSGTGSGAQLRPIVDLNPGGMGADPRNDLNSSALMYTVRLVGNEYETFNVQNDFRQIGLIENPTKDSAAPAPLTSLVAAAMKKLYINPTNVDKTTIGADAIVFEVANPENQAIVDYYQEVSATVAIVHCHQNLYTGWNLFTDVDGTAIQIGSNTGTSIKDSDGGPMLRPGEMDNFSGKVLYIDNRVPIERDANQTEDIKIIIDL